MKSKFLLFVALALTLIANACSPTTPTSDCGAQTAGPPTEFEMVLNLKWSPDGGWLVFSTGPWDAQKVVALNVSDRSTTVRGTGRMPDVNR